MQAHKSIIACNMVSEAAKITKSSAYIINACERQTDALLPSERTTTLP